MSQRHGRRDTYSVNATDNAVSKEKKMTKNIGKCLSLELEFDVFADFTPAEKGDPQTMDGPGSPDYPAQLDITSVQFQGVEIKHLLKRKQLGALYDSFVSELENEDPS
jgi:hypothetical protein